METTKLICRECRDGEITADANYRVKGTRTLENSRKIPYSGTVCDMHLESIQADNTDLYVITKLK
jgi:hypothetical protein